MFGSLQKNAAAEIGKNGSGGTSRVLFPAHLPAAASPSSSKQPTARAACTQHATPPTSCRNRPCRCRGKAEGHIPCGRHGREGGGLCAESRDKTKRHAKHSTYRGHNPGRYHGHNHGHNPCRRDDDTTGVHGDNRRCNRGGGVSVEL